MFILTFSFSRPIITLNWSEIVLHSNNVFEFSTIEPLRKKSGETDSQINDVRDQNDPGKIEKNLSLFLCRLI